jgi:hypothetical protein
MLSALCEAHPCDERTLAARTDLPGCCRWWSRPPAASLPDLAGLPHMMYFISRTQHAVLLDAACTSYLTKGRALGSGFDLCMCLQVHLLR